MLSTQPEYLKWSQMQIVRDMKEEFLMVSDDMLENQAGKQVD